MYFVAPSHRLESQMPLSEVRDEFQARLAAFLWSQWGQMGVAADTDRRDTWAVDPEALLLLTLEVGRGEPRLFEEVLDWLLVNERLVSVQRLRNLAVDAEDQALVEAVLGWLGQNRQRQRLKVKGGVEGEPRPFFRNSRLQIIEPDPAFLAQGFLKPGTERSGKSRGPDLSLPINFAFRLRLVLGIGVRAEVARVLLTVGDSWINALALADYAGYAKRNVQEAVAAFAADGLVRSWTVGNENRYETLDRRWGGFLDLEEFPSHRDWRRLFHIYRRVLRWLIDPSNQKLSDYMFSSRARTLHEEIEDDLRQTGFPVRAEDSTRDLANFGQFVRDLLPN
ncbi:MAG: hypothetical protein JSS97_04555 [Actinobacteria bacterium]|nr:hypothetical protein [Actinomycetota bacterium]